MHARGNSQIFRACPENKPSRHRFSVIQSLGQLTRKLTDKKSQCELNSRKSRY